GTSYEWRGFSFSTPPFITADAKFWLVLEYVDSTGVDASNYIVWQYETGANTYGEARAVYSGTTWTATTGENHVFGLWNNLLDLSNTDVSWIAAAKLTGSLAMRFIFSSATMTGSGAIMLPWPYGSANSYNIRPWFNSTSEVLNPVTHRTGTEYTVVGATFEVAASTGKMQAYVNGRNVASANGTAGAGLVANAQPFVIGGWILAGGAIAYYFQGLIGPIIITSNKLSAAQIGKVSHYLMALRKLRITV
ncbi:MAG: hypothetical protein K6U74_20365, partial [Firmicutes bacterium]|nr:hypothetical protein [Bacillota bacterium]